MSRSARKKVDERLYQEIQAILNGQSVGVLHGKIQPG